MRNLLVISTAFLVVTLHWGGCGWAEEEPAALSCVGTAKR